MVKSDTKKSITRPPVVVVLGHIDHGKSSLLEAIRDFKITSKESGGITQHIGAYQIEENRKKITFIDTPGHEAFSQMRSRGAGVADIALLVIDAAEGIKVQTKEAILNIKQAKIPFIVVLNKIDKPEAQPEKVKRELAKEDIIVEDMGGKVPLIKVSALTKQGIPELIEMILLIAEMADFKFNPESPAKGVVIESYSNNLRGPTATIVLSEGKLKVGDVVGTISAFTKIKSLENFQGSIILEAFASDPIIIFGFTKVPKIGEELNIFPDIETAENNIKNVVHAIDKNITKEPTEDQRVLNLILKTDVEGSTEAIEGILAKIPQDKIILRILKSEAGNINESDIKLAKGNRAFVLGFRVKVDQVAKKISERDNIRIVTFNIIYELVENVRNLMERMIKPEQLRVDLGKVRVLAQFLTEKNRQIIGGRVSEGEVRKGVSIEVFRDEEKIGQGRLINLQRNKKDIGLVTKGDECGILFEGDIRIKEGDTLVIYHEERSKRSL